MTYYIMVDGVQIGPMTIEQMSAYNIHEKTPVRTNENEEWRPLLTFPELMSTLQNKGATGRASCDKDKNTAGILALLVGSLGIQYFYIGKTTAGLLTILLTLVTCGLWSCLTFVQGILILIMSQQDFERKFIYTQSKFPLF